MTTKNMFSSQLYSTAFLKTLITNSVEVVSKYAKSVGHCSKIVFSSLRTIDSPRYMKSARWETSELRTYIHTTAKFCLLIFSYSNLTLLQLLNNRHLQGEGIDPPVSLSVSLLRMLWPWSAWRPSNMSAVSYDASYDRRLLWFNNFKRLTVAEKCPASQRITVSSGNHPSIKRDPFSVGNY